MWPNKPHPTAIIKRVLFWWCAQECSASEGEEEQPVGGPAYFTQSSPSHISGGSSSWCLPDCRAAGLSSPCLCLCAGHCHRLGARQPLGEGAKEREAHSSGTRCGPAAGGPKGTLHLGFWCAVRLWGRSTWHPAQHKMWQLLVLFVPENHEGTFGSLGTGHKN